MISGAPATPPHSSRSAASCSKQPPSSSVVGRCQEVLDTPLPLIPALQELKMSCTWPKAAKNTLVLGPTLSMNASCSKWLHVAPVKETHQEISPVSSQCSHPCGELFPSSHEQVAVQHISTLSPPAKAGLLQPSPHETGPEQHEYNVANMRQAMLSSISLSINTALMLPDVKPAPFPWAPSLHLNRGGTRPPWLVGRLKMAMIRPE